MILNQAKHLASHRLSQEGIDDALFEAELLICHALKLSQTQLYTEFDRILTTAEMNRIRELVQHRLQHEPTAYILKQTEFYGIDFYIDQRVFIPRPETELLVEETLTSTSHCFQKSTITIADVGTGSGAIAVTLALALPQARIYAIDISDLALQVAAINCQRHKVAKQIKLLQGSLLEPLSEPVDIILANLPYIKDSELELLSPEIINFEATTALAGGEDGLDKIRTLLIQIPGKIRSKGCILIEIAQGQAQAITSLTKNYLPQSSIELIPDLSGIDRVAKICLP